MNLISIVHYSQTCLDPNEPVKEFFRVQLSQMYTFLPYSPWLSFLGKFLNVIATFGNYVWYSDFLTFNWYYIYYPSLELYGFIRDDMQCGPIFTVQTNKRRFGEDQRKGEYAKKPILFHFNECKLLSSRECQMTFGLSVVNSISSCPVFVLWLTVPLRK